MAESTTVRTHRSDRHGRASDDHSDFLAQLAQRESRGRVAKRPPALSAEEHAENRKRLRRVTFVKPVYADETQINVAGIFRKWKRYCEENKVGGWESTLKTLQRETTMDFFLFVCGNYNIKSWGTSHVYIRQFQQLYTTVTGRFMDRNDAKEVYKYHRQVLIPRFGYRAPNSDPKPVISMADLQIILVFNMAYDTTIFPSERHRIQLAACYKIMSYTGARPAELVDNERRKPDDGSTQKLFGSKVVTLSDTGCPGDEDEDNDNDDDTLPDEKSRRLDGLLLAETKGRGRPKALCYEDISLMIVRHPSTGQVIPAMAIRFIHHKGADNKPKPTVFYFTPTKKLIFCVISDIIALALYDDAFDVLSLKKASDVLGTTIPACKNSTPLRWKVSMLKIPVFRRFGRNGELSDDKAMLYSKLRDDMGQQSEDAGFEVRWTPKVCRRGASNAANGNALDAVRDQMMRYDPKFLTFHDAYLNQMVEFDLQNTFLEEQTESELYKLFAHVSLTRDPRAKRDMVPDKVWDNLPPDPELVALEQRQAMLKQGRLRKGRREYLIAREYREYYFYTQPTRDIERQARGEMDEEYEEPKMELHIPERAGLAALFINQPDGLSDEEVACRRVQSIDLKVSLCGKRETRRFGRVRTRRQPELPVKQELPEVEPMLDHFPLLMDPAQCPVCIGDDRLSREERTFSFCRPTIRNDHFDDQHLEAHKLSERRGNTIRCEHPKCTDVKLTSVDHFRNHVLTVHQVALRSEEQARVLRNKKHSRRKMARCKKSR
ncbi:FluG domain-containing protein [Plectosphaerella cucumerina]|uniref:FluG domain-containing protein n=1 Tax=Plectosphaerella cucumerina TaxID=40658 RepID=A0A8K0TFR1_9PEZI|nr:FluG domain-containing protein [Plectosphaerella cucumerina]